MRQGKQNIFRSSFFTYLVLEYLKFFLKKQTSKQTHDFTLSVSLFSLYGRHMQANPEPPKKNNDKSKKISRKPLAAKNK